jgi:hypothetical protein
MTFGAGGHTRRLLESAPDVRVFGLDRDPIAHYEYGKEFTQKYPGRFVPLLGRFSELPRLLLEQNVHSGTTKRPSNDDLRRFSLFIKCFLLQLTEFSWTWDAPPCNSIPQQEASP